MEGQRPLAALLRSSRHTTSVADPDDFFPDPTQRSGFGSLILKIITGTGTVIISKSKLSLLFKTFYLQIFLFVVLKFIPYRNCFVSFTIFYFLFRICQLGRYVGTTRVPGTYISKNIYLTYQISLIIQDLLVGFGSDRIRIRNTAYHPTV